MVSGTRILSIGDDDDLRLSRVLILRSQGYLVESITSNQALKAELEGRFQVAVISQTVSSSRAVRIAAALRERDPEIRILRIQEFRSHADGVYDQTSESLCGPRAFLRAIDSLCSQQKPETETRA